MFIKILGVLLLVQAIKAQNWCDPSLCGTSQHIACNHNGQFAPTCVNPVLVPMTQALINLVLNTHNSLRNTLASGAQTPLLRAARMATMTWNADLAHFASLNVRQCVMRHDSCRNTFQLRFVGQNAASRGTSGAGPEAPTSAIPNMINSWYSQHTFATQAMLNRLTGTTGVGGNTIGHFTQTAQDRATQIGCALLTHLSGGFHWNIMICNYARGNLINQPVYVNSGVSGSACITGMNPSFTSLCSVNEPINVNEIV